MIFAYHMRSMTPGLDAQPAGYINSDFVLHVERVVRRGDDGVQIRAHIIGGTVINLFDDEARRVIAWYDAEADGEAEEVRPRKRREQRAPMEPATV